MKIRTGLISLLSLMLALIVSGCLDFDAWEDFFGDDEWEPDGLNVQEAALQGEVGTVGNLDHSANDIVTYGHYDATEVTIHVENEEGAAMNRVTIRGDLPTLREGETVTLYDSDDAQAGVPGVSVDVLGCSGYTRGAWDYDRHADDVAVLVARDRSNPRLYVVSYTAAFPGSYSNTRRTEASGYFTYLR